MDSRIPDNLPASEEEADAEFDRSLLGPLTNGEKSRRRCRAAIDYFCREIGKLRLEFGLNSWLHRPVSVDELYWQRTDEEVEEIARRNREAEILRLEEFVLVETEARMEKPNEPPIDFVALRAPLEVESIEWRIGQAGRTQAGKIWAKVLAYTSARAIAERLDEICGPARWWNEFRPGPAGGVLCGITILCGDRPVTKWDGAENTEFEAIKGGLSDAIKRAAVQWGIGRYLYDLEENWAEIVEKKCPGSRWGTCKIKSGSGEEHVAFHWLPPTLPNWALPAKSTLADPSRENQVYSGEQAYAKAYHMYILANSETDYELAKEMVLKYKSVIPEQHLANLRIVDADAKKRIGKS